MRLKIYKSMAMNNMHASVLKELADVIARPFFNALEKSWLSGDWNKRKIVPTF